jgi:Mrp family chromosome partitioning ATPase
LRIFFNPQSAIRNWSNPQSEEIGPRFQAETMRSLLRQLRQQFPLIFVDGPPWDGRQDVTMLGATCDAVFLVLPEQDAETAQTDALLQFISNQGARLAGCILVGDQSPFR